MDFLFRPPIKSQTSMKFSSHTALKIRKTDRTEDYGRHMISSGHK